METPFRITPATLDVLEVLLGSGQEVHGFAVAKAASRPTGSVYPILARLQEAGWVESHWETRHPEEGRPARRFYSLSNIGLVMALAVATARRGKPAPAAA